MSKRRGRKRSTSEKFLWVVSMIIVGSMVLSLILVALPGAPEPAPTPWPTAELPTFTPWPTLTLVPTEPPATVEPTEPPAGPELPSATPEGDATEPPAGPELPSATPEAEATPTVTPTLTVTPSSAAPVLRFAVCGDSRDNPAVYRRVLDSVMAGASEFLLNTGDLVNKGTEAQWQGFRETMAGFTLSFYPVPGNHDGLGGELDGYLAYSGAPAARYSFDRGPVHFTLADSHQGGISSAELAWLREDLSVTGQPVKMVFLHHPPFDPDGTDHIMAYGNQPFMDLMVEQAVDYVFAGHIHAYAREVRDGVAYIITGGAGAPLYSKDHPQSFHHYLEVTVQGEEVTVEIVKI